MLSTSLRTHETVRSESLTHFHDTLSEGKEIHDGDDDEGDRKSCSNDSLEEETNSPPTSDPPEIRFETLYEIVRRRNEVIGEVCRGPSERLLDEERVELVVCADRV